MVGLAAAKLKPIETRYNIRLNIEYKRARKVTAKNYTNITQPITHIPFNILIIGMFTCWLMGLGKEVDRDKIY
jgi:hypothetical protein